MTIFEYIVIAYALLFTAAAMRLIGGLSSALDPEKRYPIHYAFVFVTLLGIVFSFWNFYGLHVVSWTLPKFLVALSMPGLLYYMASVLIPENPNDVASWREYYYSVRVRYFAGLVCWVIIAATMAYVFLGLPLMHPARIGHAAGLALGLTGLFSSNPRVHGALAVILALMLLAMTLTIAVQPGWLDS